MKNTACSWNRRSGLSVGMDVFREKCAVYESAVAELFASEEAFFDPDNIKVL